MQQDTDGEKMILPDNTARVSAMLQFLFHMDENDVVIFEHVDMDVDDNNVSDYVVNAFTPLGTLVEMKGEQYTLQKLASNKDKFSLEKDGRQFNHGKMYAFADLTIVKKPASKLNPDDYRSLAYTFNGEHNQSKQQKCLRTRGDIIMCNAVVDSIEHEVNEDYVSSKWNIWGEVKDKVLVCKFNGALESNDYADVFLENVLFAEDNDIPESNKMFEVECHIEDAFLHYNRLLSPSVMRFVSEFKDICPTFQDAVYELDDIDNFGKKTTVSFADYRGIVSVLKKFLDKKLLSKNQWESSFIELYMLQDKMNKPKFDMNNDDHVKSFIVMCYKKAAWFKTNHQKLLQARYMLQCYNKTKKKLKSWAKWLLFVVEHIIVMSKFAQSVWETRDLSKDAEQKIAFRKSMTADKKKLLGDFHDALVKTSDALFPSAEGEVFSAVGAFRTIKAGLEKGRAVLLERGFQEGAKRKKLMPTKAGPLPPPPKPKNVNQSRDEGVMGIENVFNIDGQPERTSKQKKKKKKKRKKARR